MDAKELSEATGLTPKAVQRILSLAEDEGIGNTDRIRHMNALSSLLESEHFPELIAEMKKLYDISADTRDKFTVLGDRLGGMDVQVFGTVCRRIKLGKTEVKKMSDKELDCYDELRTLAGEQKKLAAEFERRNHEQKKIIEEVFLELLGDLNCWG